MIKGGRPIEYIRRDTQLMLMGLGSYRDYLQSDLWKSIRARVLQRDGGICRVCNDAVAYTAHHKRYKHSDLSGATIKHLIAICRRCHYAIEFKAGRKVGIEQASARIRGRLLSRRIQSINDDAVIVGDGYWPYLRRDLDGNGKSTAQLAVERAVKGMK